MEFNDIKNRLKSLGYEVQSNDEWLISFLTKKVTSHVMAYCNIGIIPKLLEPFIVDMICGEFLLNKKDSDNLEGFNLDSAVKSIQEGDTTVTFSDGSMTTEQRLNKLIDYLTNERGASLKLFRRLKW